MSEILFSPGQPIEYEDESYIWYKENSALIRHIQRFASSLTEGGGHGELILRFANGMFIGSDSSIRQRHPEKLTQLGK